jgi:uncharacterized membrane protein
VADVGREPVFTRERVARAVQGIRPECLFLVLGALFGLCFLVLTPPFQVPDEPVHFLRAYQVSQGQLVARQDSGGTPMGYLPVALNELTVPFKPLPLHPESKVSLGEIAQANAIKLDGSERTFVAVPFTAPYNPVCYLPQAIGILVGRVFHCTALEALYLARLGALIAWLVAVFWAVKTTPVGKWAFVAVSLLPMTVFEAPSVAADSFTYAMVALTAAYAAKYSMSHMSLSRRQVLGIVALSVVVSCVKTPYSLVFLILILAPLASREGRRHYLLVCGAGLLLCSVLIGSWYWVAQRTSVGAPRSGTFTSTTAQLNNIARNPRAFPVAFRNTYFGKRSFVQRLDRECIGVLGWLDTPLPPWAVLLGNITLILSFLLIENRLASLPALYKAGYLCLFVMIFLGINLLLYLSWNAIGADIISGLQGRYFLAMLIALIPIAAMRRRMVLPATGYEGLYFGVAELLVLSAAAFALLHRYFLA